MVENNFIKRTEKTQPKALKTIKNSGAYEVPHVNESPEGRLQFFKTVCEL